MHDVCRQSIRIGKTETHRYRTYLQTMNLTHMIHQQLGQKNREFDMTLLFCLGSYLTNLFSFPSLTFACCCCCCCWSCCCCCCCCCLTCAATAAAMEEVGISMVVKVPFSLGIWTCTVVGVDPSEMLAVATGCCCHGNVVMICKSTSNMFTRDLSSKSVHIKITRFFYTR